MPRHDHSCCSGNHGRTVFEKVFDGDHAPDKHPSNYRPRPMAPVNTRWEVRKWTNYLEQYQMRVIEIDSACGELRLISEEGRRVKRLPITSVCCHPYRLLRDRLQLVFDEEGCHDAVSQRPFYLIMQSSRDVRKFCEEVHLAREHYLTQGRGSRPRPALKWTVTKWTNGVTRYQPRHFGIDVHRGVLRNLAIDGCVKSEAPLHGMHVQTSWLSWTYATIKGECDRLPWHVYFESRAERDRFIAEVAEAQCCH
mmetsp:Transcript_52901/g.123626  ORF Transcript_52901/g.123626 Transcript_52901/m.123626 type:complete len:252 (-) Transcript_52901:96-851(-)